MGKNHLRSKTNWGEYFASIRQECPWSNAAWLQGQIDVVNWTGTVIPLDGMQARVYVVEDGDVTELAKELDVGDCEWLFSYPGYGPFATPTPVLIQQSREKLNKLREKL